MVNFWEKLTRPFSVLAPMDGATDFVFREILARHARPDVFFTEFTNVEGLFSRGRDKTLQRLRYSEKQRPIVAQIWGKNPENFKKATELIEELGFDGIDINMGCPERSVVKHGCCSALIDNRALAHEIIEATKEGRRHIPISVKTRIGTNKIVTEEWMEFLLKHKLQAVILHGRTAKELSKVPNHWEEITKAVNIKNKVSPNTIMIGNGDVTTYTDIANKHNETGVDGVMIGRGVFHNVLIFDPRQDINSYSAEDKLGLMLEHTKLFVDTWQYSENFSKMKRFFKIYISGFPGSDKIKQDLMDCNSYDDVLDAVKTFSKN